MGMLMKSAFETHRCEREECPANRTRKKLEAAEKLAEALAGMKDYTEDPDIKNALIFAGMRGHSGTPDGRRRNILRYHMAIEALKTWEEATRG
jgi:hypothetical protein